MEEVTCVTGASSVASVDDQNLAGHPGITRREYDPSNSGSKVGLDHLRGSTPSYPMTDKKHELVFEMPSSDTTYVGHIWDGYLKAPVTGDYRFFLSCDDQCELSLDSTSPLSANVPFTPETIANRWWYSGWRDYLDPPHADDSSQSQSRWITLQEGQYYKIKAIHQNGKGESHMTVSVEIKAPGQGPHRSAAKETQVLKIDQENQPETWEVIVTDPSNGEFKLTFKHPTSLENITTDAMKSNVSASDFNS
jgi:hypothetical protein